MLLKIVFCDLLRIHAAEFICDQSDFSLTVLAESKHLDHLKPLHNTAHFYSEFDPKMYFWYFLPLFFTAKISPLEKEVKYL